MDWSVGEDSGKFSFDQTKCMLLEASNLDVSAVLILQTVEYEQ